jgi:hypothetical protein
LKIHGDVKNMLKDHKIVLEDLDMANVFKPNNALTLKTHVNALFG